jgi:altronate dehydratase large subunit
VTTLVEKATGNIRKGGHGRIEGVLSIAESPPGPGLWLMENLGIDPASLAGLAAADAQIVLFTTGRGTPVGSPICPVIKICASPTGNRSMAENIDVSLTDIVMEGASVSSGSRRIMDLMEEVVNGTLTKSEQFGHTEFVMPAVGIL